AHGAIANDGDHLEVFAAEIAGSRDAAGGGDGGGRVSRAKDVVLRFLTSEKAGKAAPPPDGGQLLVAASEDLVGVALVANVPEELIARGVEYPVQGDAQLHRPQIGPEVRPLVAGD